MTYIYIVYFWGKKNKPPDRASKACSVSWTCKEPCSIVIWVFWVRQVVRRWRKQHEKMNSSYRILIEIIDVYGVVDKKIDTKIRTILRWLGWAAAKWTNSPPFGRITDPLCNKLKAGDPSLYDCTKTWFNSQGIPFCRRQETCLWFLQLLALCKCHKNHFRCQTITVCDCPVFGFACRKTAETLKELQNKHLGGLQWIPLNPGPSTSPISLAVGVQRIPPSSVPLYSLAHHVGITAHSPWQESQGPRVSSNNLQEERFVLQ